MILANNYFETPKLQQSWKFWNWNFKKSKITPWILHVGKDLAEYILNLSRDRDVEVNFADHSIRYFLRFLIVKGSAFHWFIDGSSINNFNSIVLHSLLETKIVFKDQIFDLIKM